MAVCGLTRSLPRASGGKINVSSPRDADAVCLSRRLFREHTGKVTQPEPSNKWITWPKARLCAGIFRAESDLRREDGVAQGEGGVRGPD